MTNDIVPAENGRIAEIICYASVVAVAFEVENKHSWLGAEVASFWSKLTGSEAQSRKLIKQISVPVTVAQLKELGFKVNLT